VVLPSGRGARQVVIRPEFPSHSLRGEIDEGAKFRQGLTTAWISAFAIPRDEWPAAFEQIGIPKGQTGEAEAMFDAVNAGWMDLGVAGTEHVPGVTSARDVFAAAYV
jgi:hypothetical protein